MIKKQTHKCICPECRKRHSLRVRWVGNGTPRILCEKCRRRNNNHGSSYDKIIELPYLVKSSGIRRQLI